jgi:hypothetical protein
MNMIKTIALATLLGLAGCATCQEHPIYCATGAAIIVGSVAASFASRGNDSAAAPRSLTPQFGACGRQPC